MTIKISYASLSMKVVKKQHVEEDREFKFATSHFLFHTPSVQSPGANFERTVFSSGTEPDKPWAKKISTLFYASVSDLI